MIRRRDDQAPQKLTWIVAGLLLGLVCGIGVYLLIK